MRDLPQSLDLLALARELLLDELTPLLPPERRRDAHLIATTMAIAAREAIAGEGWRREVEQQLEEFYPEAVPHPPVTEATGPSLSALTEQRDPPSRFSALPREGRGEGQQRLRRFAADLRNGAFETSPSRERAARAILWRLTIEKLREGNPHFLAANGLRSAGGRET